MWFLCSTLTPWASMWTTFIFLLWLQAWRVQWRYLLTQPITGQCSAQKTPAYKTYYKSSKNLKIFYIHTCSYNKQCKLLTNVPLFYEYTVISHVVIFLSGKSEISQVMTNILQYCNTKNYLCRLQCQYQLHTIQKRHILNDELETTRKQWKHILKFYFGIHTCPGEPSGTTWQLSSLHVASLPISGPTLPVPLLPCKHFTLRSLYFYLQCLASEPKLRLGPPF